MAFNASPVHRLADVNRFSAAKNYLNNLMFLPYDLPDEGLADVLAIVNRPVV
jgi:hypothetical protein